MSAWRALAHRAAGLATRGCARSCPPLAGASAGSRHASACTEDGSGASSSSGPDLPEREAMPYDVCIVGAGPAGLAAAIRLKQLCREAGSDLEVCVVEKGSEVGAHVLSGNVFDPRALDELLPEWREMEDPPPVKQKVTRDLAYYLTGGGSAIRLPTPPTMHNAGSAYVISLSALARWMGRYAEEQMGVDIFPGFAASQVLYDEQGGVRGVATSDMGIAKDGSLKDTFVRGIELQARCTLFAEGCRGSLSETLKAELDLESKAGAQPQTYGLGLKEVWSVREGAHNPGEVWHTVGHPLDPSTYGGGFLYHMDEGKVAVGLVVGLDYKNPHLSPFQEFQRLKAHPKVRGLLEGGQCLQYGARTLIEGGWQSLPLSGFRGGSLLGCAAGTLNAARIKGTHTAMKSGMIAAETAFEKLAAAGGKPDEGAVVDMTEYDARLRRSWVGEELYAARNFRPGFHFGLFPGMVNAALDAFVLRGRAPWTLRHAGPDHLQTEPASQHAPLAYPSPDGEVTFDIASSLYRSGTNHDHNQPAHLQIRDARTPVGHNLAVFDGPEQRFCPAGVYEFVEGEAGGPELQINAQNCLHCKACSIKDNTQNICWTVPEGGGGPSYTMM